MNVFVTVGSMLPFDRLVLAVDAWAAAHPEHECFAQIGESRVHPKAMASSAMVGPAEYRRRIQWCDLLVSHVGMGTVITAAELGRPVLLLPRRPELAEVTSDHQTATAKWLAGKPGVMIAEDEVALTGLIGDAAAMPPPQALGGDAAGLLETLRLFVADALGQARGTGQQ